MFDFELNSFFLWVRNILNRFFPWKVWFESFKFYFFSFLIAFLLDFFLLSHHFFFFFGFSKLKFWFSHFLRCKLNSTWALVFNLAVFTFYLFWEKSMLRFRADLVCSHFFRLWCYIQMWLFSVQFWF